MHVLGVYSSSVCFFFKGEDGIRDLTVTGVQTCALPIFPVGTAPSRRRMKPRPSFPARLDATLAKTRPNPHGAVVSTAVAASKSVAQAALAKPTVVPTARAKAPLPHAPHMPQGHGMDSQAVRQRMVQKLAGQGVTDPLVLGAMGAIERHRFVDSALVNQAYEDTSLPIGLGQTISKPGVVSRMIELLRNGATGRVGRVLEIGTGCGYQAAVLSLVDRKSV